MNQPLRPLADILAQETPGYLEGDLLTYIGNKRALLPFLAKGIHLVCEALEKEKISCLDLFAGSGAVSRLLKGHASFLWANDLEYYASCVNACYLQDEDPALMEEARHRLPFLEKQIAQEPRAGFIAEMYAPRNDRAIGQQERVFYTRRNAIYLDTARQHLAHLPRPLQTLFLGPLLVDASIHANTGGVFKGFYKNHAGYGAFGGAGGHALSRIKADIHVRLPTLSRYRCPCRISQKDAQALAHVCDEPLDLVYLDPPYNQHPYGSNYFMLNLIAHYEKPEEVSPISGIPRNWTRSPFNKPKTAAPALFDIIDTLKARYFLISYNSEGFIGREEMERGLAARGTVHTLETRYNTFRASRNLKARSKHVTEYLFLLKKKG